MAQEPTLPNNSENEPRPTTARLMRMLESSPNQFRERHLPNAKAPVFHEYLYGLMEKRQVSVPELITRACISKTYAYQFINGERLPGRDIILRIALAMQLSMDETQRLLTLAGKAVLYPKIRRDASVLYCLKKKMTLDETNSFLEDLGEVTLL